VILSVREESRSHTLQMAARFAVVRVARVSTHDFATYYEYTLIY
jgi:hypothetical protein